MALNTWEFSYNGLTFGGGQDFGITNIDGMSPPNARVDEVERAGDHGSYIFAQFLEARTITIEGNVLGSSSTDFDTKVNQLRAAFAPQNAPQPLSYNVPGGPLKRIYCIPTKVDFPFDLGYANELLIDTWTVELMAEDPRIYSDALNGVDIFPAIPNGIGFNLAFNVNFGGTSGGSLTQPVSNNGTFPTLPVVYLYGPVTNPILRNVTTGYYMKLDISTGTTDVLTIDFSARTILLNGLSSRYSSIVPGSSWWPLQPGANTVQLSGAGITGNTKATVAYRDAWN